jgi:predicted enzyme related to lactoylglutathione lyase
MADNIRGRFLWHELMTTDPRSAEGFYTKIVGWKTKAWDQTPSYKMWMAAGRPMGGLMKHMEEDNKLAPPPSWFSYIGTSDVDATVDQAIALGGKVVKRAWDIPTIGRMAILQDPQGAMFYVFTPETGGAPPDEVPLSDFSWHELLTTNWQSAWNFYQKLLGWEKTSAMDMGGGNTYQMFAYASRPGGPHGIPVGGMFNKPKEMPGPPQWLPYALVPDAKKTVEAIKQLGGSVLTGPMEVPGGDWIVTGMDRQGAMFAVHSRNPSAGAAAAAPKPREGGKVGTTAAAKPTAPTRHRATAKTRTVRSRKMSARSTTRSKPARRAKSQKKARSRKGGGAKRR